MYSRLFIIFLCFISISTISGAENGNHYFTMLNGFKLVKSNYTWSTYLLQANFSESSIPNFEVAVKDLVLPNEELLNSTWKFHLGFSVGTREDTARGMQLKARYERVGPLANCNLYGKDYYITGGGDGRIDPWDLIVITATLSSDSIERTVDLGSFASSVPNSEIVVKNPSGNGCRTIRANHFDWFNLEKDLHTFVSSEGGAVTKINLSFKIQFISQLNNDDVIKKYNNLVNVSELAEDR